MSDRHVVLIGMMGAGKSTVGRVLAEQLGRAFRDADEQIEQRAGRSVADIFATDGEATFRALEAEVLGDLLLDPTPSVIAAGGGSILDADTRDRLRARAVCVWLRATTSEIRARLGSGSGRPLLADGGDVGDTLDRLLAARSGLYLEVADAIVDVDALDPTEVADRVVHELGQLVP